MEVRIYVMFMMVIYVVVFLSAFGPKNSEKKFWKTIFKIRAGIDTFSRWFFNVCGVAALVIIFYYLVIKRLAGIV